MKVRGGRNLYGHPIGILVLDTVFPRIPGDIGHAGTFPLRSPVLDPCKHCRSGAGNDAVGDWAVGAGGGDAAGAESGLQGGAVRCDLLGRCGRQLAEAVRIPVFTSALQLVPIVSRMLGPARAVGILTVESRALGPRHLAGAGIAEDINVVIWGLERGHAFTPVLLENETELDVVAARRENVEAAKEMVERHPEVAAIVLECTNMPPYAAAIREATGLPVFDITTLIRMVYAALVPPVY